MEPRSKPSAYFKELLHTWKQRESSSRRARIASEIALKKDVREIIRTKPNATEDHLPSNFDESGALAELIDDTTEFVSKTLLSELHHASNTRTTVVSPMAGGQPPGQKPDLGMQTAVRSHNLCVLSSPWKPRIFRTFR